MDQTFLNRIFLADSLNHSLMHQLMLLIAAPNFMVIERKQTLDCSVLLPKTDTFFKQLLKVCKPLIFVYKNQLYQSSYISLKTSDWGGIHCSSTTGIHCSRWLVFSCFSNLVRFLSFCGSHLITCTIAYFSGTSLVTLFHWYFINYINFNHDGNRNVTGEERELELHQSIH